MAEEQGSPSGPQPGAAIFSAALAGYHEARGVMERWTSDEDIPGELVEQESVAFVTMVRTPSPNLMAFQQKMHVLAYEATVVGRDWARDELVFDVLADLTRLVAA